MSTPGEVFFMQDDGEMLRIGHSFDVNIEPMIDDVRRAGEAFGSCSVSFDLSAETAWELSKLFAAIDRQSLTRRRAIAKARGKNWRNIR